MADLPRGLRALGAGEALAVRPHHAAGPTRVHPHCAWGDEETFLRIVMHLREHGREEVYGGDLYTYLVADGFKHWTMGADLMSTILINRKPVGQDEGDGETEERPAHQPGLFRAEKGKGSA